MQLNYTTLQGAYDAMLEDVHGYQPSRSDLTRLEHICELADHIIAAPGALPHQVANAERAKALCGD